MRNGFVIAELLIALVIIAILALIAAPSYRTLVTQQRLTAAAESLYSDLQLARSEAIRKQSTVYVAVQTGTNWCYGLSDSANCDCTVSNSCQLNGAERVVRSTSHPNVSIAVTGLTGNAVSFEGVHGTTGVTGQVDFTSASMTLSTAIRSMGHVRVCSSHIGGYSPC